MNVLWIILATIIILTVVGILAGILARISFRKRFKEKVKELTISNEKDRYVFSHQKELNLIWIKDQRQNMKIVSVNVEWISSLKDLEQLQKIITTANLENWNHKILVDTIKKSELEFKEKVTKLLDSIENGNKKNNGGFWKGMFWGGVLF